MNQLKALYNNLTRGQRVSIAFAFLAVVGGLAGFLNWSKERDFKPLYTNVAPEDAGQIVQKLKESGVDYRVSDGGSTILARSAKVDELRLQIASVGLPKSGRIGYELFDRSNFGITEFAEQVNYHRALEGEIERSVMALDEIQSARVHLTLAKESLFVEEREQSKASVLVRLKPERRLSPANVAAITHLVSSAVKGLAPEGVSVLDMQGNLLSRPVKALDGEHTVPDSALDYKQRIERDLLLKINSSLEPVLGPDRFRAGVSVDCDFTSGEQSEETFDPNRSVMVTSQKTEDVSTSNSASGVPGTASNLPRPTSRQGGTGAGVTRRTENITYQSSRLVKRLKLPQGSVKRMSVSVLVAQSVRWEGQGTKARRIVEPPSPEKLQVIESTVAGVIGLQPERGDKLVVGSLPWDSAVNSEPPPEQTKPPVATTNVLELNERVLLGVGAALGLLVILMLIRKLGAGRKRKRAAFIAEPTALPAGTSMDLAAGREHLQSRLAEQAVEKERQEAELLANLKLPQVKTQKTEVLSKHISDQTRKNPLPMVQVLRTWLNEK